jgi:hypothetical protein
MNPPSWLAAIGPGASIEALALSYGAAYGTVRARLIEAGAELRPPAGPVAHRPPPSWVTAVHAGTAP